MFASAYICVYVRMDVYICVRMYVGIDACMHARKQIYMWAFAHLNEYIGVCVFVCLCGRACMRACVCVCA